jgi:hypothetical protein
MRCGAGAVTHIVETWRYHTHLRKRNRNLENKTIRDSEYDENPMGIQSIPRVQNTPFLSLQLSLSRDRIGTNINLRSTGSIRGDRFSSLESIAALETL